MPCILKVRIVAARNLPVMDRATDLTGNLFPLSHPADAFVEVKFSDYEVYKTQIQRRSLNPIWNEDFRFEVSDDSDLQNEPLELKILDYDQITYHDSIGTVFIDLNPLLTWDTNAQISGWFPIYDTLLGVRGEVSAQIKLQFFGDINPFKDSSAGVQFFTLNTLPSTHQIVSFLGFVSAIDNEDDPEYHWSDNFRTPRTSNEARTRVMFKLSGHIRRQVGKKVLELNGNAVIGFKQYFDLESEKKAITARAIGCAVKIISVTAVMPSPNEFRAPSSQNLGGTPIPSKYCKSPNICDSPTSSVKDLGMSFPAIPSFSGMKYNDPVLITLHSFPRGAIIGTGGLVSATSIKVIDNDERAVREAWWTELRDEIKSHAKALSCPFIIGYSETTSINEELAVLHCSGTAAWIDISAMVSGTSHGSRMPSVDFAVDKDSEIQPIKIPSKKYQDDELLNADFNIDAPRGTLSRRMSHVSLDTDTNKQKKLKPPKRYPDCEACHITYPRLESPFPMAINKCLMCKTKFVPEILLTTIEPPTELKIIGQGRLVEAHVCRQKKIRLGDTRANYVSESIPFCQYDIHRQLTHKLRIYGLNAVFGLKIQFTIGESLMTAVATGTAIYVRALPQPPSLKVFRNLDVLDEEDKELLDIQRKMMRKSENNRKLLETALEEINLKEEQNALDNGSDSDSESNSSSNSDDGDRGVKQNLRNSIVVQIDDEQDEDLVLLMDPDFSEGFTLCNTAYPPFSDSISIVENSFNIQTLTVVKQSSINMISHHPNRQLADIFKTLYQDLQAQVSFFEPTCVVTGITYDIHLPKDNFVQISLTAVAMGPAPKSVDIIDLDIITESIEAFVPATGKPGFLQNLGFLNRMDTSFDIGGSFRQATKTSLGDTFDGSVISDDEEIEVFQIEEDGTDFERNNIFQRGKSFGDLDNSSFPIIVKPFMNVEITPLSYIPQSNIKAFLGRISLHFVKEASVIFESGTGKEGIGGFTHVFFSEIFAVTRAHAAALGGNAALAFSMDQVTVIESIRNQAYALVSLSADVVEVEYDGNPTACQSTFAERLF